MKISNDNGIPVDPGSKNDPGSKKDTDGYSKQITPGKIVNEQEQEILGNNQRTVNLPNDLSEDEIAARVKESDQATTAHSNEHLSEKSTEEAEHITPETIEEDRKQEAGINP